MLDCTGPTGYSARALAREQHMYRCTHYYHAQEGYGMHHWSYFEGVRHTAQAGCIDACVVSAQLSRQADGFRDGRAQAMHRASERVLSLDALGWTDT